MIPMANWEREKIMSRKELDRVDKLSLPQHKHCPVCGKSMDMSKAFCSTECEKAVEGRRKSQRRSTWIMLIVMGVVLLLFWVLMPMLFLGRPK